MVAGFVLVFEVVSDGRICVFVLVFEAVSDAGVCVAV